MTTSDDRNRDGYRGTGDRRNDDVFVDRDRDGRDDRTERLGADRHDPVDYRRDHDVRDGNREAVPAGRHEDPHYREDSRDVQREVIAREKEEYGGIKWGSAFFGWLTAVGTAVLLTAFVAGTGTALGLAADSAQDAAEDAVRNASTVGIVGAVILALVIFIAYYAGGYVAGRMARLDGAKQGLAVWIWAIVIAVVVAIIGTIGGAQFNVLANLNGFPRLPIGEGEITTIGIITAVVLALVSLGGAVLGGVAGMRYHRKLDRAGLGIHPV
jgi:hypothetical protein